MKQEENKTTWTSSSGYIWSLIGSAVGFANILGFSAQCYKNGGGAFLIPYFVALLLLGIPLMVLEGIIGQKWQLPLVTACGRVFGRLGKVLGWVAVLACISVGSFYIVLTGYSVCYTYFAAVGAIPEDTSAFFKDHFLGVTPHLSQWGNLAWPIFLGTVSVAVMTWWVMVKDINQGVEKLCSFFMPLLAVIVLLFAIVVSFLPGGLDGWVYYLKPDFSRLTEMTLWRDIFGQLLFSLSLGLGIIVGYSRHTKKEINIAKAMAYTAFGDFAVSFISGAAIFGCIAHISSIKGVPFDQLMASASTFEIGFILFPKILQQFGSLSIILGVLFFFCIFIAGITGVFSIVESIAGNFEVEGKMTRRSSVTWTIVLLTGLSLFYCFGNGVHVIDALAPMVVGTNMLVSSLCLIGFFKYFSELGDHPVWFRGGRRTISSHSLRLLAPLLLTAILFGSLWQELQTFDLAIAVRWAWFVGAVLFSIGLVVILDRRVASQQEKALSYS